MKRRYKLLPLLKLGVLAALLLTPFLAKTQEVDLLPARFAFDPALSYDPSITTPTDFLGYQWGERFTIYEKTVQYCQLLAREAERVQYGTYGETYEGRPLIRLVISSRENLQRLAELKERHHTLADPKVAAQIKEAIVAEDPVFLSYSYSIHGNEASSTESAMQVAYRLAAAQDTDTQDMLDKVVIVLYVCINPDGRDRYVYWINSVGRQIPGVNPQDLEHYAPWPNGRTNHYWFDLNRDWLWGVHPESRGHIAEYQEWMPQVHVDYHEQGYQANYFTTPGATPRNLLLPKSYEAWSDTFGQANIAAFNQLGISYFTRERFDFFYPGYGSSYPSVMGAIGMLTEQGGIGAGRAVKTEDNYILTFRQRIYDHYLTSIATLQKTASQREALLRYSLAAWNPANSSLDTRAYLIRREAGGFGSDFLQVLARHHIVVEVLEADYRFSDCLDYRSGKTSTQTFRSGDYLIRARQPRHLLINSLLSRNMAIEDSVMYDMASWSAPLAYNLEAYSTTSDLPDLKTRTWEAATLNQPGAIIPIGSGEKVYAFLIEWQERHAPRALAQLWHKGYRVRSAAGPFRAGAQRFGAGTLIVLAGRNEMPETQLFADMTKIAVQCKLPIYATYTGRMQEGLDLASPDNRPAKQPRLGMLVEPPFNTYTSGQVYFLFDQETALPINRIRTTAFAQTALPEFSQRYGRIDINDYDVLILPGGSKLNRLFWQDQRLEISKWLQRGGTLIALESAAEYFTEENKMVKVQLSTAETDTSAAAQQLAFGDRKRYRGLGQIPGSALRGQLDTSHPLAFGIKPEVYTLKRGSSALIPDKDLQSVGRYYPVAAELLTAGYAAENHLERLAGKTFAGVLPFGQGRIVYLLDNPHYRMFWRGSSRMLQNAAMLLPGF